MIVINIILSYKVINTIFDIINNYQHFNNLVKAYSNDKEIYNFEMVHNIGTWPWHNSASWPVPYVYAEMPCLWCVFNWIAKPHNKLASLEATLVETMTHLLTESKVKCRATSVAKNLSDWILTWLRVINIFLTFNNIGSRQAMPKSHCLGERISHSPCWRRRSDSYLQVWWLVNNQYWIILLAPRATRKTTKLSHGHIIMSTRYWLWNVTAT